MVNLYLTRHGQTEWNVEKRMQGQDDSPLTDLGERQALTWQRYYDDIEPDAIYASSSPRAIKTAELMRGEKKIEIIPRDDLREIYLGSWQGMLLSEVEAKYPEPFDYFWNQPRRYAPSDGETFAELRNRLGKQVEKIAENHQNENVLIITHGVALKSLYTYFKYQPIEEISHSPHPKSTCFCNVKKENGIWNVLRWNETEHYKLL